MVMSILIGFFFSVNDSMVTFKNPDIKVLAHTDTSATILYRGKIEEYETGSYYYPKFMVKEIKVEKRQKGAIVKIILRIGRSLVKKGNFIVFTPPEEKFYLKLNHASPSEIETLLKAANIKCTWLDSLKEKGYTIQGTYTESSLKKEFLKYGRGKKAGKIKER